MAAAEEVAEGLEAATDAVSDFDASVDDFSAALKAGDKEGMRMSLRSAFYALQAEDEEEM